MKTISNDYKQELIKLGRQIDFKFALHTNDKILTEDSKFLITEDNKHLVVEQFNEEEIDEVITSENIYNVSVVRNGKLLSTIMQGLDFEVANDLRIGDTIDASFGLLVGNDYEWVDFGRYMIYSKEFNEDTKTYSYVAYDSMLLSMVTLDDRTLVENVTLKNAIENIASKVGLSVNITEDDVTALPNLAKVIATDTFKDLEMTYRDVLDMICQALGINMLSNSKVLTLKTINRTPVDTINEEYLKDTNVKFGKKYGPINSIVLSRSEDNDNLYKKDQQSIDLYGLTEFKIKDNLIMLGNDREDYIDEIYNQLHNLEYYINDFKSTGITYLELLDMYNVSVGQKTYKCLLLNDEIKIRQGLEESIYTEEPEETTTDYKTSSKTDKEVSFIVDKQRKSINAKVSKGDVINEINLDESGASINANKISLAGKDIDLTADNITINATNFSLNKDGNLQCVNARVFGYIEATDGKFSGKVTSNEGSIGGWTLGNNGLSNNTGFYVKNTGLTNIYTMADIFICSLILRGIVDINSGTPEFDHYDLNKDGEINSADMLAIRNLFNQ